jgi:translation initiation factor 3 subunit I
LLIAGGQDAKDVTTTKAKEGSFETRLFHLIYEEEMAQITGHFGPVHSISWAPDGRGFVTASEDGTVRLQRFPLEFYETK